MRVYGATAFAVRIAAVFSLLPLATVASAATLTEPAGKVLVNAGAGYNTAPGATSVAAGTKIMVQGGSSAKVVYNDLCIVKLNENTIYTVAEKPPCEEAAAAHHDSALLLGAGAVAVGVGVLLSSKSDKSASP